jgi:hypothetical protein
MQNLRVAEKTTHFSRYVFHEINEIITQNESHKYMWGFMCFLQGVVTMSEICVNHVPFVFVLGELYEEAFKHELFVVYTQ